MVNPWHKDDMAQFPKVGSDDTRKAYVIPASFMVLGEDKADAERKLKSAMRLYMNPYNLGIVKAEIGS